jgi:hypothetical protein
MSIIRGPVDHRAPSDVDLDEALRQFGEHLLHEPIPQRLLQVFSNRSLEEADRPDRGSQLRYLHAGLRAPPGAGRVSARPFSFRPRSKATR